MANMSYCRFENTTIDLQDCLRALKDAGSMEELKETVSEREYEFAKKLINICTSISETFAEEEFEDEL